MDAATLAETNKLRVSLGMKPLPVPGQTSSTLSKRDSRDRDRDRDRDRERDRRDRSRDRSRSRDRRDRSRPDDSPRRDGGDQSTVEGRQALAYDNFRQKQEQDEARRQREKRMAAIKKARELAQRHARLEGHGLGEEKDVNNNNDNNNKDTLSGDAKSWLLGQKKRQAKIAKARRLEEELAEAEAAAARAIEYTSKDLAGIRVAHDMDALFEGDAGSEAMDASQILTLKDATIEENEEEGDELENMEVRNREKLAERLELKKKGKSDYNPLDYLDGDDQQSANLLSKYDEEIYGKQGKKFTLDADGAVAQLSAALDGGKAAAGLGSRVSVLAQGETDAIDDMIDGGQASTDYLDISEIKVKKPKKSKKNKKRKQPTEDEEEVGFAAAPPLPNEPLPSENMEVDEVTGTKPVKRKNGVDDPDFPSSAYLDDTDLQASLTAQRQNALRKRKKMAARPDFVRQLKELPPDEEAAPEEQQENGLVLGEVSEFVSNLQPRDDGEDSEEEVRVRKRKQQKKRQQGITASSNESGLGEDTVMQDYTEHLDPLTGRPIDQEPDDDHHQDDDEDTNDPENDLLEEKAVSSSMGAALSLLRDRGILQSDQLTEHAETHERLRKKQDFLFRKNQIALEVEEQARRQRERDRASGALDRMSARERDEWARQQNASRETQQSRRMAELFAKEFVPTFQLAYHDETGRQLNTKEAFKHMSHHFHGKGSGKGKTEKHLKKLAEERRQESQSILDTSQSHGISSAAAQQVKKRQEAGVRLA